MNDHKASPRQRHHLLLRCEAAPQQFTSSEFPWMLTMRVSGTAVVDALARYLTQLLRSMWVKQWRIDGLSRLKE